MSKNRRINNAAAGNDAERSFDMVTRYRSSDGNAITDRDLADVKHGRKSIMCSRWSDREINVIRSVLGSPVGTSRRVLGDDGVWVVHTHVKDEETGIHGIDTEVVANRPERCETYPGWVWAS